MSTLRLALTISDNIVRISPSGRQSTIADPQLEQWRSISAERLSPLLAIEEVACFAMGPEPSVASYLSLDAIPDDATTIAQIVAVIARAAGCRDMSRLSVTVEAPILGRGSRDTNKLSAQLSWALPPAVGQERPRVAVQGTTRFGTRFYVKEGEPLVVPVWRTTPSIIGKCGGTTSRRR
ncbi:MAG: hypothetical protein WBP12_03325 [Candidatus Saccharimonas sp.]